MNEFSIKTFDCDRKFNEDSYLPDTGGETESVPQNIHREANEASVGDHRRDREKLEDGHPGTDVLRSNQCRPLVEL